MKTSGYLGALFVLVAVTACGDDTTGSGGSGAGTGGGGTTVTSASGASTTSASTAVTSTTSTASAGDGGGGAAGTGGEGTGGSPVEVVDCGENPELVVTATFVDFTTSDPVEGVVITADICEGVEAVTDASGVASVRVPAATPYNARAEADGYVTVRTSEAAVVEDLVGAGPMYPEILTAVVPGWSDETPTILITTYIQDDADPEDPCGSADGIVYSVVDHPEAEVTYYDDGAGGVVANPDLTATTVNGVATIVGLEETGGEATIELEGAKDGCDTLSFESYPHHNRNILENGVLTYAIGFPIPNEAP